MSSVVQGMELYKFEKILLRNMIIRKEAILTQDCKLPLNGSQLYGVITRYVIPYT